jgi:hypothetical protein
MKKKEEDFEKEREQWRLNQQPIEIEKKIKSQS